MNALSPLPLTPHRVSISHPLRAQEFPWTADTIYLNNASVGPLPERTRKVLDEFNRKRADPFQLPDRELFATMAESRRLAAGADRGGSGGDRPDHQHQLRIEHGGPIAAAPARATSCWRATRSFRPTCIPGCCSRTAALRSSSCRPPTKGWPDEARLLERLERPAGPGPRGLAGAVQQRIHASTWLGSRRRPERTGTYLVVDAIQGVGQLPLDLRRRLRSTSWPAAPRSGCSRPGARASCTSGGS